MKNLIYLLLFTSLTPLLLAQPQPANDNTSEEGGDDGASGNGFMPLTLGSSPGLNYSVSFSDETFVLKNTSEQPSTIVIYIQTENWLAASYSFRLEPGQEIDFDPPQALSPVKTIQALSMQSFEVVLREAAPLIESSAETILQAQAPPHDLNLSFIEDAGGQVIPVGVMDDGSVHYPLFGKRIGVVENDAVLIDGTQQRFELLEPDRE